MSRLALAIILIFAAGPAGASCWPWCEDSAYDWRARPDRRGYDAPPVWKLQQQQRETQRFQQQMIEQQRLIDGLERRTECLTMQETYGLLCY